VSHDRPPNHENKDDVYTTSTRCGSESDLMGDDVDDEASSDRMFDSFDAGRRNEAIRCSGGFLALWRPCRCRGIAVNGHPVEWRSAAIDQCLFQWEEVSGRSQYCTSQKVLAIRDRENDVLAQIEIPYRPNLGIRFA
jgi:hypothetical protein